MLSINTHLSYNVAAALFMLLFCMGLDDDVRSKPNNTKCYSAIVNAKLY